MGFAFDSPDELRIVMIFASSTVPASKIMGFYGSTLAQLGWDGDNGRWIRGEEKLLIGAVKQPWPMATHVTAESNFK